MKDLIRQCTEKQEQLSLYLMAATFENILLFHVDYNAWQEIHSHAFIILHQVFLCKGTCILVVLDMVKFSNIIHRKDTNLLWAWSVSSALTLSLSAVHWGTLGLLAANVWLFYPHSPYSPIPPSSHPSPTSPGHLVKHLPHCIALPYSGQLLWLWTWLASESLGVWWKYGFLDSSP